MSQKARCEGKQKFASATLANSVASRNRKVNDRRRDTNRKVYRCNYCGGWHVGTDFSRTRRLRKANGASWHKIKEPNGR